MAWTDIELAYFGGILDGEGTISVNYRRFKRRDAGKFRTYHRPYISVGNTDFRLVEWLKNTFGGFISTHCYKGPNNKTLHTWICRDRDLDKILDAVMPYLLLKKSQAECVRAIKDTVKRGATKLSPDVIDLRERMTLKIRSLNQRGVK